MKTRRRILNPARRPRIALACGHIRTVRIQRGRNANGDSLLGTALRSIRSGRQRDACKALEAFMASPDVSNEQRFILTMAIKDLWPRWLAVLARIFDALRFGMKLLRDIMAMMVCSHWNPLNSFMTFAGDERGWTSPHTVLEISRLLLESANPTSLRLRTEPLAPTGYGECPKNPVVFAPLRNLLPTSRNFNASSMISFCST